MKQYGLALGGGSARGLVHIGVLKYLEEQKIEITEIAGTSMGAMIGAGFALGMTSTEIYELGKDVRMRSMIDVDMKMGILKGEKAYNYFETIFEQKTFADTVIPLKIIATNIETGEIKIFQEGKISDAVRASTSLPWIFQPYQLDGELYIDGGVVTNFPIDLLESKNKIGVSTLKRGRTPLKTKKTSLFGRESKRSFFGFNSEIFSRGINILMSQNEERSIEKAGKDAVIIIPEFGDLSMKDFQKIDQFVELGYNTAKQNSKIQ